MSAQEVKVTQADRDAAARYLSGLHTGPEAFARHRQSAHAETLAVLEQAREALEGSIERVMNVSAPAMEGDNLAVLICSHFDNPDQESDDDCGWSPDAVAAYEQIKAAIEAHFAPVLTALTAKIEEIRHGQS